MLISILAPGSHGDTQPYVALGGELVKSGYQVRMATFNNFPALAEDHGLEFFPIKGDVGGE